MVNNNYLDGTTVSDSTRSNFTHGITTPDNATTSIDGIPMNPSATLEFPDGKSKSLTGFRALASADDTTARNWQLQNPGLTLQNKYRHGHYTEDISYGIGKRLNEFSKTPGKTLAGRLSDYGPLAGGALGAGVGAGAGLLGSFISNIFGGDSSYGKWSAIGAGAGGLLGALQSYLRNKDMAKSAAMYKDPRNLILEKLEKDTSLDIVRKAKFANKIRSLGPTVAGHLAAKVREELGTNIGPLLSEFFNCSNSGMLSGVFADAVCNSILLPNLISNMNQDTI